MENITWLIHDLVVNNPHVTTEVITERLWDGSRLTSKTKYLCRKLNPNDLDASLKIEELEKLMLILNDVCKSDDSKDATGGCAIVHYLAGKLGMTAVKEAKPNDSLDFKKTLSSSLKILNAYSLKIIDCLLGEDPLASATRNNLRKESYKARSALLRLDALIGKKP